MDFLSLVNVGIIKKIEWHQCWQLTSEQWALVFRLFTFLVELLCLTWPIKTPAFGPYLLCHFPFFILAQCSWEQRCFVFLQCYQIVPISTRQSSSILCWLSESQSDNYHLSQSHIMINFTDLYIYFPCARSICL